MPRAPLGLAVIGVGVMGKRHAENLVRSVPAARVLVVADTDRERARAVANELGVAKFTANSEEALRQPGVEAVVLASPAKFHAEGIRVAAAAGKAILCEKPLALTLAEADRALAAVEKAGVFLQLGFMRRYDPAYAAAKERIDRGDIGEPLIFKAIGRDPKAPPPSYFEAGLSGSLFLDSSIHEFDLARWLMGDEVARVQATGTVVACPQLAAAQDVDIGFVNLHFARGGIGNVESFRQGLYGYDIRTEVIGSKGTLQIGFYRGPVPPVWSESTMPPDFPRHFLVRFEEAYLCEMQDFVGRVCRGAEPAISGFDGRQALAIALAAERSYRESRILSLNEIAGSRPGARPKPEAQRVRHHRRR